jgi:translation initiation factor 1 (eIF-1/SUI1)
LTAQNVRFEGKGEVYKVKGNVPNGIKTREKPRNIPHGQQVLQIIDGLGGMQEFVQKTLSSTLRKTFGSGGKLKYGI